MAQDRKVALITGSAKGIGKTTALALADRGYDIVVNYVHSQSEAHELRDAIVGKGVRCLAVQADITVHEDVRRLVGETERAFGRIDVLVNNAGPFIRERKRYADYTWGEVETMIRGNLLGVMQLDYLVLPLMRRHGWGRIVHFGFGRAGEARGWPHRAAYAAAKVGLVSFTKTLAEEEAEFGITVNMICPGDIRGGNKERSIEDVSEEKDPESPRGRPGSGQDISRVIEFLCDPLSDFITGNIMDVTGALDPIRPLSLLGGK